jgi:ectoine hydroxylase-related dioxygenase (phytanoyl-CoA dioxygenase family)
VGHDIPEAEPLPVPLPEGAALVYDTRLHHRGGANRARRKRAIFYVAVLAADGLAPAGLPYTIEPEEVACYALTRSGVARRAGAPAQCVAIPGAE